VVAHSSKAFKKYLRGLRRVTDAHRVQVRPRLMIAHAQPSEIWNIDEKGFCIGIGGNQWILALNVEMNDSAHHFTQSTSWASRIATSLYHQGISSDGFAGYLFCSQPSICSSSHILQTEDWY
jgi:hypothetical protein